VRPSTTCLSSHRDSALLLAVSLAVCIPMVTATQEGAMAGIASAGAGLATLAATALGLQPTQVGAVASASAAAVATVTAGMVIYDYVSPSTRVKGVGEAKFARSGGNLRWSTVRAPGNCGM
jgi:hypothetical protein